MRTTLILFALMLGGCAAHYAQPELPPSHPANPAAESAPPSDPSRTLALPDSEHPAPAHDPMPETPHEHHHGASGAPSSTDSKQPAAVEWIGEMHKAMHDGDVGAKVRLSDLAATPHLSAIGPLAGLKGEITVIDGRSYIATAEGGDIRNRESLDAGAAFIIYTHAGSWKPVPIPGTVHSLSELEAFVPEAARSVGIEASRPLAFRIEGTVKSLAYHVINRPDDAPATVEAHEKSQVHAAVHDQSVRMIGFYSTEHRGIFTHADSSVHVHFVSTDGKTSGHVESFELAPGASLLLAGGSQP